MILLVTWICFRLFFLREMTYTWDSIYNYRDRVLDSIYEYSIMISQQLTIRDYILIICSVGLDFFLVLFLFIYLVKGNNMRPIINIIYYYIGTLIFNIRYDNEINTSLYSYPGFPGIVMYYNERCNSFYIGLMIIFMLHFYNFEYFKIFYFSVVFNLFLAIALLLLRANLTINIILGVILAHLTYIISEKTKIENKKKKVVITRRVSKLNNDVKIDISKDNNDIYVMNYD